MSTVSLYIEQPSYKVKVKIITFVKKCKKHCFVFKGVGHKSHFFLKKTSITYNLENYCTESSYFKVRSVTLVKNQKCW